MKKLPSLKTSGTLRFFNFSLASIVFIAILALFSFGCKSIDASLPFGEYDEDSHRTQIISTKNGDVRGIKNEDSSVELFAGIPFAAPPVGNLRWREAQDFSWDGLWEADHFAKVAMQNYNSKFFNFLMNLYIHSKGSRTDYAPTSEDCLYLNIWRPEGTKAEDKLPVLVYVHGGSLMTGSSWFESYDGENLCKEGIIVVTIAYRTGVFGYFALEELEKESPFASTGNYGLLDQIKALKWVNENIEAFGGDVNNITIAGESAGSSSVNALCASPLTKGMFRRAIGESSSLVVQVPSHTFRSKEAAFQMGHDIMKEFNASSLEDLRKIPAEKLIKTKYANNSMTVDGYALTEYPWETYAKGQNHEEALINGFNAREGFGFTFFTNITKGNYKNVLAASPYIKDLEGLCSVKPVKNNKEAKSFYSDIFGVICFTYPHYSWSKVLSEQGRPVYEYYFSKENRGIGTNHSGEMIYAYRNVPRNKNYDEKDYELEKIMSTYWVNFVKYGNPNGPESEAASGDGKIADSTNESKAYDFTLPRWQTYSESDGLLLELGEKVYMREDPFEMYYNYIDFDIEK
ncbi:MAG: carboxylesterase family protein [Treponema sp.]|nr:carboxylesterase family protein [Treponema sp.]